MSSSPTQLAKRGVNPRWLAPLAVVVLALLLALAANTQSRQSFQSQQQQEQEQQQQEQERQQQEQQQEQQRQRQQGQESEQADQQQDESDSRSPEDREYGEGQSGDSQSSQSGDDQVGERREQYFTGWEETNEDRSQFSLIVEEPLDDGTTANIEVKIAPSGSITADRVQLGDEEDLSDKVFSGVRIDGDGNLIWVEKGEEVDGDYLVYPTWDDDGILVEKRGGSLITGSGPQRSVELQINDENIAMIAPDGTVTEADIFSNVVVDSVPVFPEDVVGSQVFLVDGGEIELSVTTEGDLVATQPKADAIVDSSGEWVIAIEDGDPVIELQSEVLPGTPTLVPNSNGFDRVGSDGLATEIRPDEDGTYTATEILTDGTERPLEPGTDGFATCSDGARIGPLVEPPPPPYISDEGIEFRYGRMNWRIYAIAVTSVALASIALALALRLGSEPEPEASPSTLTELQTTAGGGLDSLIAELRAEPDPGKAIRRAFEVAEAGFGSLPPRLPTETPFEWASRVDRAVPELAQPVDAMCSLFAKVRFAPGDTSEGDRQAMLTHLVNAYALATAPATAVPDDLVTNR